MTTALIIGASRGLGRALAEEHLKRGWHVIATVRDKAALADLAGDGASLEIETLDVIDWKGVDALRQRLDGRTIDLLFVNAGISGPATLPIGDVEAEPFTELMLVNALAPLRLIERFADLVTAEGTIAVMSSGLGSIAGNQAGGWEPYRMSKAALNMGLRSLAVGRGDSRRTYLAVAPGWVRTDMGGPEATLSIEESIPRLVDMLERRQGAGGLAYVTYQDVDLPW